MIDQVRAISGIHVYPLKACRGISVGRARVTDRGLEHDRRWMIADARGRFVSQRERSELALVTVVLQPHGYFIEAPERPRLELPFELARGKRVQASVWSSSVWGLAHPTASEWFSEFLGEDCRVLYMPQESHRTVSNRYDLVSFADGYPLLMISEASLEELNRRSSEAMSMARFRPNLVVSGGPAHFEDELESFSVGDVRFDAPKLCDRCVVTTIDPETGRTGPEPLKTLATYRRWDQKVWFGTNLVPQNQGMLELGQRLEGERVKPRHSRR